MARDLIIGGVVVTQDSRITVEQTFNNISAINNRRLANGSLVSRNTWHGKLSTEITGTGYIPVGLVNLDFTQTQVVSCIAPKAVTQNTNVVTLPTDRRTDTGSLPYARALVSGKWQSAASSLVGDDLTITDPGGATQFQGVYFPEITCMVQEPREGLNIGTGFNWSITAEQI